MELMSNTSAADEVTARICSEMHVQAGQEASLVASAEAVKERFDNPCLCVRSSSRKLKA